MVRRRSTVRFRNGAPEPKHETPPHQAGSRSGGVLAFPRSAVLAGLLRLSVPNTGRNLSRLAWPPNQRPSSRRLASVVARPVAFFLQVYEPVAVRVGEKEHGRRAVEVHDLVVVKLRARLAKSRVGGLGAGRAQPYGHRDFAVRRQ